MYVLNYSSYYTKYTKIWITYINMYNKLASALFVLIFQKETVLFK